VRRADSRVVDLTRFDDLRQEGLTLIDRGEPPDSCKFTIDQLVHLVSFERMLPYLGPYSETATYRITRCGLFIRGKTLRPDADKVAERLAEMSNQCRVMSHHYRRCMTINPLARDLQSRRGIPSLLTPSVES
jgi:hypothetical protein